MQLTNCTEVVHNVLYYVLLFDNQIDILNKLNLI